MNSFKITVYKAFKLCYNIPIKGEKYESSKTDNR